MDKITICDLEVFYHVGVPEVERSKAQRLLLSVEMQSDFTTAAAADDLAQTIDYSAVCQRLLGFGQDCHWELIETLAVDIAQMIRTDFSAKAVSVEVKKFIIPQARYIAVSVTR
ncbi:MAG: dihydroneopterin aldolase [Pedosphaera sp.]|nr:dihydroneopterin aldolase [Pedosphaera sp.]